MGIIYGCVVHLHLYTIIQDRCYNQGANIYFLFVFYQLLKEVPLFFNNFTTMFLTKQM